MATQTWNSDLRRPAGGRGACKRGEGATAGLHGACEGPPIGRVECIGFGGGGGDIVRQNRVDSVKHFALVGTNGPSRCSGSSQGRAERVVEGAGYSQPARDAQIAPMCCGTPRRDNRGLGPCMYPRTDQGV